MLFFIVLYQLLNVVNSILIEDLEPLFNNKHCLEASLVLLSLDKTESIMLDSENRAEEAILVNASTSIHSDKSMISKMNELAQHNNVEYMYKLISEEGQPHAKVFTVKLILGDETYEATESSLKKTKQKAAILALENTFYEHPSEKINTSDEKPQTPTVVLNSIAVKLGIGVSYHLLNGKEFQNIDGYGASDEAYGRGKSYYEKINSTSNPFRVPVEESQISGPFNVKVNVGDLTFNGIGHTIQAARHHAAARALQYMEEQALFKDSVCSKEESVKECIKKKESLKSPISRIYEAGNKHNLEVLFNVASESGRPDKRVFVTQCKLGSFTTEGEGHSKKESKKQAAEKMLKYLTYLPETYAENAIVGGLTNKKKINKKKKKIIRDNNDKLIDSVSQIIDSLWGDGDILTGSTSQNQKTDFKKGPSSAKDQILEIGNKFNIPIEFTDVSKHAGEFYSLISLGLKPPHVCFGKAVTRELSHEKAASYAILFLRSSGIFEKMELEKHHSQAIDDYYFEAGVAYKSFESVEESK